MSEASEIQALELVLFPIEIILFVGVGAVLVFFFEDHWQAAGVLCIPALLAFWHGYRKRRRLLSQAVANKLEGRVLDSCPHVFWS